MATQLDDSQTSSFDESDEEFVDLLVDMADLQPGAESSNSMPLGLTENPLSRGDRPSSQVEKPLSQGERPSSQDEKPLSQREEPSSQGDKLSTQGENPQDVLETAQSNNGHEESDKPFKSDATEHNPDSAIMQSDDIDLLNDGDDDMFLSPDDEAVGTIGSGTSQSLRQGYILCTIFMRLQMIMH